MHRRVTLPELGPYDRVVQVPLVRGGEPVDGLPSLEESREHLRTALVSVPGRASSCPGASPRSRPSSRRVPDARPDHRRRAERLLRGRLAARRGGAGVAAAISAPSAETPYDRVVATRDHHVDPGVHFSDTPDFVDTWPPHCLVGTPGRSFHPALDVAPIEAVFPRARTPRRTRGSRAPSRAARGLRRLAARARASTPSTSSGSPPTTACGRPPWTPRRYGFHTRVLLGLCAGVAPESE